MNSFLRRLFSLVKQSPPAASRVARDARFTEWTFFDTCCLSELVKLADSGEEERVRAFVRGLDVAVPTTVLQELRHASPLAVRMPDVFASASLYLIPHPTTFWDYDLWKFFHNRGSRRPAVEVLPIATALIPLLNDANGPLLARFERAEQRAASNFAAQVERDRQQGVNERKLATLVWGKVNELAQAEFGESVDAADCRPENFPSLYTYYYLYYYRFLAQRRVVVQPGDFIDLAHASAAPYCRAFYAERKLVQLLRKQVKGHIAPTPFNTATHFYAEDRIDRAQYEEARHSDHMRRGNSPLLLSTDLVTHMEMREAVLAI